MISISSSWSLWSYPASNTDTYPPGYPAPTPAQAMMILAALNVGGGAQSPITYGGNAATLSGVVYAGGPIAYVYDLSSTAPASDTLSGLFFDFNYTQWSAAVITGASSSIVAGPTAGGGGSPTPITLNLTGYVVPGDLVVVIGYGADATLGVSSTDGATLTSTLSPNQASFGCVVAAYQFPTTAPSYTFTCTGGLYGIVSFIFSPSAPPPDFTLTAGVRYPLAFQPVVFVKAGTIRPAVYMPVEDTTVVAK